jgi:predicted acyl esterase
MKTGDKVKVLSIDELIKMYPEHKGAIENRDDLDGVDWICDMYEYCGKVHTITGISSGGFVQLNGIWRFEPKHLTLVTDDSPTILQYMQDSVKAFISRGQYEIDNIYKGRVCK